MGSWEAAKASHEVLLCRMEQGEIESYSQEEKNRSDPSTQYHKNSLAKTQKAVPCHYLNQGTCSHNKTHDTKGSGTIIFVVHVFQMEKTSLMLRLSVKTSGKKHPDQKTNKR